MMPNYNHICLSCEHTYDVQTSIGNRDAPSMCTECGLEGKRNWSGEGVAPMPMQNSFADGHTPARRKGMMKEAAEAMRLKGEAYSMDHRKRADINNEIRKIDHATQTTNTAKKGDKD